MTAPSLWQGGGMAQIQVPPMPSLYGDALLWAWYALLVSVSAFNLAALALAWKRIDARDEYGAWMKRLAVPWVLECAWRSVFPSLYLQRYVFWDTPLNAILVDRTWACVGELAYVAQTALALVHLDGELRDGGTRWVRASGAAMLVVYVFAEAASYYNVATTNELWAAIEVAIDALAYVCIAPAVFSLRARCPADAARSARLYCGVLSTYCVVFPLYNFFVDVPMYLQRYAADEAAGKVYLPFWRGLVDAATTRIPTHALEDWRADMFWMTAYFSLGAWSGILLMVGPRVESGAGAKRAPV